MKRMQEKTQFGDENRQMNLVEMRQQLRELSNDQPQTQFSSFSEAVHAEGFTSAVKLIQ